MKRTRRTQEERRAGTIRRLLDAARETLVDAGYAGATVQAICARAGLSQGGLFRHFATREALMAAVGEDVGRTLLARYQRDFQRLRGQGEPVVAAIELVRASCRSRQNVAWFELTAAARTSPSLRRSLRPVARRYYAEIERLAAELLPELAAQLGPRFPLLIDSVIVLFDGEVVHHALVKKPALEAERLALLSALARSLVT